MAAPALPQPVLAFTESPQFFTEYGEWLAYWYAVAVQRVSAATTDQQARQAVASVFNEALANADGQGASAAFYQFVQGPINSLTQTAYANWAGTTDTAFTPSTARTAENITVWQAAYTQRVTEYNQLVAAGTTPPTALVDEINSLTVLLGDDIKAGDPLRSLNPPLATTTPPEHGGLAGTEVIMPGGCGGCGQATTLGVTPPTTIGGTNSTVPSVITQTVTEPVTPGSPVLVASGGNGTTPSSPTTAVGSFLTRKVAGVPLWVLLLTAAILVYRKRRG